MKYLVAALCAIIVAIFIWGMSTSRAPAADLTCAKSAIALQSAKERFQETPAFSGVSVGGAPVTFTMSPKGTWTMFMAQGPNLCAVAAGQLKLAPEIEKPKTSAPMLMPHGLRLIRD